MFTLGRRPKTFFSTSRTSGHDVTIYPDNVPVGGITGLTMTSCQDVACHPLTEARQAIAIAGGSATWSWDLIAQNPGIATIALNTATYSLRSDTALRDKVILIKAKVVASSSYQHEKDIQAQHDDVNNTTSFINTSAGLITTVGGAVVVIAGGVTWLIKKVRKSRKAKKVTSR
jgi:hypothetical protein